MNHWGKIFGAIIGLATGKPFIVLLGLILGHQFDRGIAKTFNRVGSEFSNDRIRQFSPEFFENLFQAIGHIAKADGRVTEEEIQAARILMDKLGLGTAEKRAAIDYFEQGKNSSYPLKARIRQLRQRDARQPEYRVLFLKLLMEFVLTDNKMNKNQRAVVWAIGREMQISHLELAQLEAMLRAQSGFRHSPAGNADNLRVDEAYKSLGVNRSSSNDEIKKAYRRLMNRNHPDKLAPENPDPAVIAEAERRTREVRSAYELLKARRSIR